MSPSFLVFYFCILVLKFYKVVSRLVYFIYHVISRFWSDSTVNHHPLNSQFCIPWFQSTNGKSQLENSKWKIPEIKQFIGFKLHTVLSGVMKSQAILLCPTQDMNHLSVQCIPPTIHFITLLVIRLIVMASQLLCSSHLYFT